MIDAQLLAADAATTTKVWGEWFPRRADNAIFTLEVAAIELPGDGGFTVQVYHKNREDSGDGSVIAPSMSLTAIGRTASTIEGLKELVRYRYELANESDAAAAWALSRMLAANWYDDAKV